MAAAERVVFEHVTKRYPGTSKGNPGAVEDLSLEVPAGKVCVLVGPSGCGKTTSLKMVNRRIEPTVVGEFIDGRGVFHGDDVFDGRPIRFRFIWSRTETRQPRWEQAFSDDGGETWETNWVMDFEREKVSR